MFLVLTLTVVAQATELPRANPEALFFRERRGDMLVAPMTFDFPVPDRALQFEPRLWQVYVEREPEAGPPRPLVVNRVIRGRLVEHFWYLYHDDGGVTVKVYDPLRRTAIWVYDAAGRLVWRETYHETGRLVETQCFQRFCAPRLQDQCVIAAQPLPCHREVHAERQQTPYYWWGPN